MSATADLLHGYSSLGERLNEFLYDGKVKKGVKREHSKEELDEMLESIRQECWETYSNAKKELG